VLLCRFKRRLGKASAAEIISLPAGAATIELDNGWQLTSARIAGDEPVEVVLNGVAANGAELEACRLSEEIISYERVWLIVLEHAAARPPRGRRRS
jgi:hypothetical protein